MILSVCLLSYNSAITLEIAIKSVLGQDFTDYELIISDDCSKDNSWEVINNYAKLNPNIIPVKTPHNLGVAENANFAVSHARGKYVAILHHDDEFRSDLFTKWVKLMQENPMVGLCFNDYSCKEQNIISMHSKDPGRLFNRVMKGKKFLKNHLLKRWGCPVWGSYIIQKSIWDELNGFNPAFGILPDIDMTMQIASDWDVGYINEPLIDLKRGKPDEYPDEYINFSWARFFTLFNIHASHINRKNYPVLLAYLVKRFALKNRISFEIIKWFLYAVLRKKYFIINSYSFNSNNFEFFYSRIVRKILVIFIKVQ